MTTRIVYLIVAALPAFVLASPVVIASPPSLTEQQLEEMRRSMSREIWPYAGFGIEEADPRNAEAFVGRLVGGWQHGIPQQLLDVVCIAPAHFAPAIRDRLMRLPDTLEDYMRDRARDHPEYSITTSEGMRSRSAAQHLLIVVDHLDRAHAEPILQEFFDKVNPLAIEAERRYWQAEDAYREGVEGADEMVRKAQKIRSAFGGARGQAVEAALRLDSPIFVDEITAMLFRNDPAERVGGAGLASYYLPHFAAERPDSIAKARAGAAALFASDNPRVARAGRRMIERLNKELGPEPMPEGPLPPTPGPEERPQ